MMNAEILAIGDEITGGQLLDTNSQWLSQRLGELGVRVLYHSTVGDELQPCIDVFRRAIQRADIVISTGGLGPTADDLTREALAAATDRPLVMVPEALEHIRQLFARRKREMPKSNELAGLLPRRQPRRAEPQRHRAGHRLGRSAGGWRPLPILRPAGRSGGNAGDVAGLLCWRPFAAWAGGRVILRRNIKCFGAGESQLESLMPDLIRRGRIPRVGINASRATIILRIVAEGDSEEHCRAQIEPTVAEIHKYLGTLVYGEGDEELQDVVLRLLRQRGQSLGLGRNRHGRPGRPMAGEGRRRRWPLSRRAGRGGRGRDDALIAVGPGRVLRRAANRSSARWRSLAASSFKPTSAWPSARCPPSASTGEARQVHFALASAGGVETFHVSSGIHPDIVGDYCAKHAINLVRLALLSRVT